MSRIPFYSQQELPISVLPGDSIGLALVDPLQALPKAEQRINYYNGLNRGIEEGSQQEVGHKNKGGKWFTLQFAMMEKFGYTTEETGAYIIEPRLKRKLGHHPTSHQLVESKRDIQEKLGESAEYVRVAGTNFVHASEQKLRKIRESTNITIAPPGDINTFSEMNDLIVRKLEERKSNEELSSGQQQHYYRDHALIIENPQVSDTEHFWDPVLRGMKILGFNEQERGRLEQREYASFTALASQYGIYITGSREETVQLASTLSERLAKPVPAQQSKPIVPDGSIIYVATGTLKKYREMEKIYKAQGYNVRIRPIYELTDTYVGPKETSRTYEGNVEEKIHAAIDAWHKMDELTRAGRLKELERKYNVTKDKIFILAEDSGFHFENPEIVKHNSFDNIRHKLAPGAPFPGVETGPAIFGSHGVEGFFRTAGEAASEGHRQVRKKSVLALAPLLQPEYGKVTMHMVAAETEGYFIARARPSKGSVEIDNFIVPAGGHKTEAELGDRFYVNESPRALALKALADETGIKRGKGIVDDYEPEFVAGIIADKGSYIAAQQARKLESSVVDQGFGVIKLASATQKASGVQSDVLAKADGIVLAFNPAKAEENFWENLYITMSMIVGEQTHDKYKFLKPLKLVNPKKNGKGAFDALEELVMDFHHLGTVGEAPATLFQTVESVEQAVEELKKDRQQYRRLPLPAYALAPANEPDGTPSTKDFNVAIFCSATNENATYRENTEYLARKLIEADFGLVSGAGLYSSMGAITATAESMRISHGAQHVGSNVPHIMEGEGDAREKMHQFLLARNIYERMEFMMDNADAFAIMSGGTGTVQELALLALLKKRAITNPDDEYARQKMQGKDIVIVNSSIEHQGKRRGFFDKLIEIIPEKDFAALGIHVVENVEQAESKLKELRAIKMRCADQPSSGKEQSPIAQRVRGQSTAGIRVGI